MVETEVKNILLTLLERNRNSPIDNVSPDVKGWRFPSDASQPNGGGYVDDEQYQQPVCFWTGVTCDPIDGSITGLNLGNGFYAQKLLGMRGHSPGEDDDEGRQHSRMLQQPDYDIDTAFRKKRHSASIFSTNNRTEDTSSIAYNSPYFPSSLGKLRTLRFIKFSSNQLQGSIPKSVLQLTNLEIFDVQSNDLEGTFPLFESDALRVLDISKNRFHGSLDKDFFGHPFVGPHTAPYLFSLEKFDISHNGFDGTIPLDGKSGFYDPKVKQDGTMNKLLYFDLGYNLFTGTICNNFGHFENLQGLFLEHNRLVGTIPKALFRGSGLGANPLPLVQLYLQQNSLSGTLNEGLATLPNLKELYIDGNKLTGGVPDDLCNMELNNVFLDDKEAAQRCDGICCPENTVSKEGVAPCTPCPNDGGFQRYMGQHANKCRGRMSEVEILDEFYKQTHGKEWLNSSYFWEKGSPTCQRMGIECNVEGQVTKIILPNLGLRGPLIAELGFLSELQALDLPKNDLTGFIPSDLRFIPLERFDIRGSRIRGVVPPLMCIKEGINGNGIGPPGVNFDLLYACENIVCPRGSYSSIGRAQLPKNEGEAGIKCLPCHDDLAALYLGRDHCTDISIAGLQIRTDGLRAQMFKSAPIVLSLAILAMLLCIMFLRRKSSVQSTPRNVSSDVDNDNEVKEMPPRRSLLSLQLWSSSRDLDEEDESYSDDDWTAGYSDHRRKHDIVELAQKKSFGLPTII